MIVADKDLRDGSITGQRAYVVMTECSNEREV